MEITKRQKSIKQITYKANTIHNNYALIIVHPNHTAACKNIRHAGAGGGKKTTHLIARSTSKI